MGRGLFVVLEGVDRCGKSWQAELLERGLLARGIATSRYATPDYSDFAGKEIGDHLVGRRDGDFLGLECMQLANRYVVASRIAEAVGAGRVAICVRWWQSAVLYGEVSGQDVGAIRRASSFLPTPNLNILVDLDPMAIADRYDRRNIYEQDLAIQVRLAHAYRKMWAESGVSRGWSAVDGMGDPFTVAGRIDGLVMARIATG